MVYRLKTKGVKDSIKLKNEDARKQDSFLVSNEFTIMLEDWETYSLKLVVIFFTFFPAIWC